MIRYKRDDDVRFGGCLDVMLTALVVIISVLIGVLWH